jgi:AraC family transcriptional regulator, regulatory protein of adaptative response / DNA-3-methyladenine glycosylase II
VDSSQRLTPQLSAAFDHAVHEFLAARAVPGVEDASGGTFRRTVRLEHAPGVIELGRVVADPGDCAVPGRAVGDDPRECAVPGRVVTADPRDRVGAGRLLRRLVGPDPGAGDAHLARDPFLGPLVAARPGLRMPGTVDGGELAVRAVLGQQVSLAAARTLAARLVRLAGEPLAEPHGTLTHLWPRPEAVGQAAPVMPMPRARRRTLAALAEALSDGLRLEPGVDRAEARAELLALPGIGPWTADYVAMRALHEPDAWLPTDLGVRRGLERLGAPPEAADAWRPHRTHAVRHLWASAG